MIECVVERRATTAGKVIRTVMIVLCFVTGIVGILTLSFLPAFVMTVIITLYFSYRLQAEYEYGYYSGTLTVDQIVGGKKRKRRLTLEMDGFEKICPYGAYTHPRGKKVKVDDYASGRADARVYVIIIHQPNNRIRKVIFEPNDELLNALALAMPALVKI